MIVIHPLCYHLTSESVQQRQELFYTRWGQGTKSEIESNKWNEIGKKDGDGDDASDCDDDGNDDNDDSEDASNGNDDYTPIEHSFVT